MSAIATLWLDRVKGGLFDFEMQKIFLEHTAADEARRAELLAPQAKVGVRQAHLAEQDFAIKIAKPVTRDVVWRTPT